MIRVIIERHIAESLEGAYEKASRDILQQAFHAPGFISGESLKNAFDPNHRILLSKWRTVQDWQGWFASSERKAMMLELSPMLEREEKITVFESVY
jgi:heme-degrading monooxygenase HmoA